MFFFASSGGVRLGGFATSGGQFAGGGGLDPSAYTTPFKSVHWSNFSTNDTALNYIPWNSIFETSSIVDERASFPAPHAGELTRAILRTAGSAGTATIRLHIDQNAVAAATVAIAVTAGVETVFDFSALAGRFITTLLPVSLSYQATAASGNVQITTEFKWVPV